MQMACKNQEQSVQSKVEQIKIILYMLYETVQILYFFASIASDMMFKDIQLLMIPNSFYSSKFKGTFHWEDSPYSGLELVTATESGKQHVESVSTSV